MNPEHVAIQAIQAASRSADAAIISAIAACLAAVVGPLVAFLIARHQLRATTVLISRQKWIEDLRGELSKFTAAISFLVIGLADESASLSSDKLEERFDSALELKSRIELRLDPQNPLHARLLSSLDAFASLLTEIDKAGVNERAEGLNNAVIAASRAILNAEWEQIKKGRG